MSERIKKEEYVDITPSTTILSVLGDIPFQPWQCLAELVDNSIDAFQKAENSREKIKKPHVSMYWSINTAPAEREITVEDNGNGISLEVIRDAVRAGYSSNDRISSLGLFGMGFNIATARFGDRTTFLSTRKGDKEWTGIRIDFDELRKSGKFQAPVEKQPKDDPKQSGTKIIVGKINDGIYNDLDGNKPKVIGRLQRIYSPILERQDISMILQDTGLLPFPHCVWDEKREVTLDRGRNSVPAIIRLHEDMGPALFDTEKNRYLDDTESYDIKHSTNPAAGLPEKIVERERILHGWIGIQRYSHPDDFGIDFIRNGRKIMLADKSMFGFENSETGGFTTEYPVELGSTVGGRIVGEINVDYLIPTYQKNSFDTSSAIWKITRDVIRGVGPILKKKRKDLGYDGGNDSKLARLVSGYRRNDAGTKFLSVSKETAKTFTEKFREGDADYKGDDKWWKAAQDEDRRKAEKPGPSVDSGDEATDDTGEYVEGNDTGDDAPTDPESGPSPTSEKDDLIKHSEEDVILSGDYDGLKPDRKVVVKVWRMTKGGIQKDGEKVPCNRFVDGIDVDFFYDEEHEILKIYPFTPRQLLILSLAEYFSVREEGMIPVVDSFFKLTKKHLGNEKIDENFIRERADGIMSRLVEHLPELLSQRTSEAMKVISETPAEKQEFLSSVNDQAPNRIEDAQKMGETANDCLAFVPISTVAKLITKFPEAFLDDKFFKVPYSVIDTETESIDKSLKDESIQKVVALINDICALLDKRRGHGEITKNELLRDNQSVNHLQDLLT